MTNLGFLQDQSAIHAFCQKNGISFLGLFGSYARGKQKPGSDLDLLVRFSRPVDFFDLLEAEKEISEITNLSVDMVTEKSVSPLVFSQIQREIIPLYERPTRIS